MIDLAICNYWIQDLNFILETKIYFHSFRKRVGRGGLFLLTITPTYTLTKLENRQFFSVIWPRGSFIRPDYYFHLLESVNF